MAVPDRSPIQGLNSGPVLLRTCFRITEALEAWRSMQQEKGRQPSSSHEAQLRRDTPVTKLIELYAFVHSSHRGNGRHVFQFTDLYSQSQPPYLAGMWDGWVDDPILEKESDYFLTRKTKVWIYADMSINATQTCKLTSFISEMNRKCVGLLAHSRLSNQAAQAFVR